MKKCKWIKFYIIFFAVLPTASIADSLQANFPANNHKSLSQDMDLYASDRVLIAFKPGTPGALKKATHSQAGGRSMRTVKAGGKDIFDIVSIPPGLAKNALKRYQNNPNVLYAEVDRIRTLSIEPNEEFDPCIGTNTFNNQYALNNYGQDICGLGAGLPGADIDAPEAWDLSTGSMGIKIFILDSGVDGLAVDLDGHFDASLSENFTAAFAPAEDIYDALSGHGTHVAATACAETNNGEGTSGVCYQATVVAHKVCYWKPLVPQYPALGGVGLCPLSASIEAIYSATDKGAHVINMSYGSDEHEGTAYTDELTGYSALEHAAINYAWNNGVVLVAAAGNDGSPEKMYPASYPEVISVAATDQFDELASFSNYGDSVSIAAPGANILSSLPRGKCSGVEGYDPATDACITYYSGTSMASPHVAGAAALVWAHLGGPEGAATDNATVRCQILESADVIGVGGRDFTDSSVDGRAVQHGRLNLNNALQLTSSCDNPETFTELPPTFTSGPRLTAKLGVPYQYDGDNIVDVAGTPPIVLTLDDAPAGFSLTGNVIAWTPAAGQLGEQSITLTATNGGGSISQSFSVSVVTVGDTTVPLNFYDYELASGNPSDGSGDDPGNGAVSIENGGETISLLGNRWQKLAVDYTITPQTLVEFVFQSDSQGEVHGIGFGTSQSVDSARSFQIYGTQDWGIGDFNDYSGNGEEHYVIPVGQYFTGHFPYLYLIMDHDVGSATGESRFSHVRVYEAPADLPVITSQPRLDAQVGIAYRYDADGRVDVTSSIPTMFRADGPDGLVISAEGLVDWVPSPEQIGDHEILITVENDSGLSEQLFVVSVSGNSTGELNFYDYVLSSYAGGGDQTDNGSVTINDGGTTLSLTGNRWQKIDFSYDITPNTVIAFDFTSFSEGEVHGIGFDTDTSIDAAKTFKVHGTQAWGISDFDNYSGGRQRYEIPVGQFYTGAVNYLFFANDHDVSNASGSGSFSNIRVYEAPIAPQFVSAPSLIATSGVAYQYRAQTSGTVPISYELLVGPSGMSVSPGSGDINWAPGDEHKGLNEVEIRASNVVGSAVQRFSVLATDTLPAEVDFNVAALSAYGVSSSEDKSASGAVTIAPNGESLRLEGNRWQKIDFPYEVTADTVIEFEFESTGAGEVHGIGFDRDENKSEGQTFKLSGSQQWGVTAFDNYESGDGVKRYVIPVGQYYTGNFSYMFFIMDDDTSVPSGNSTFSNIRIYETVTPPVITSAPGLVATIGAPYSYDIDNVVDAVGSAPVTYALVSGPANFTISSAGQVSWTPGPGDVGTHRVSISATNLAGSDTQTFDVLVKEFNFTNFLVSSFGGSQDDAKQGSVAVEGDGSTLLLTGNRWQKVDFPYHVTEHTVLEFDFDSGAEGEVHGIGFDSDLKISRDRTFKLYGSQRWGIRDFDDYAEQGGVKHYVILVGQYYRGAMRYLFFAMDHDVSSPFGQSRFSNINVYESNR